jgi:ligand-binding sensor domain-containing protein
MRKVNRNTIITKRRAGILVCLLLALFLVTAVAFADEEETKTVDPIDNSDHYSTVIYGNSNGLPTAVANDITHTKDGFIWIGSYGGLIRYDGKDFERVSAKHNLTSAGRLFVDSQERMWIGIDRVLIALNEDTQAAPEQLLNNMQNAVDGFVKDAEQFDDLTMLCLEYKGQK